MNGPPGGRIVYESNVITDYLDDVFPDVPLYPRHPWERAQVKMWQAAELAMAKDYRPLFFLPALGVAVDADRYQQVGRRHTTLRASAAFADAARS